MNTSGVRLNKYLALALGISRREADTAVEQGKVTINGDIAQLGARVEPDDIIRYEAKVVGEVPEYTYLALNKPVGYVCSRRAQGENPTIYNLLPKKYHSLKPVGRLDKDSSGLILLTNDGDFSHTMTHPKFYKTKVYEAKLDSPLAPLHHQMIADYGVMLPDGKSQFGLEKLDNNASTWRITMSEGRNRQIRRTFAALGYAVVSLNRSCFGKYTLDDIKPGKFITINIPDVI